MRILWLCSIPLPSVSEKYNIKRYNLGSWIEGMKNTLVNLDSVQLGYVFPSTELIDLRDTIEGISIYSFRKDCNLESAFQHILDDFKPDIVHIFGTENPYAYSLAKAFNNPDKTIVNIQGVASAIEKHYSAGVPDKVRYGHTIRDLVKRNNMESEIGYFRKCAVAERRLIEFVSNFIGRTEFDRAVVTQINRDCRYYHCNETLKSDFYKNQGTWSVDTCERYSLFMSQAQYSVKGLHFTVEALAILKEKYPDVKLYVAGGKIRIIPETKKDYWMQNSYARYVWKLIKKNGLESNITFTGSMTTDEMAKCYLGANVFVSASTIENESNSVSEAKMLGTPVVASYVGGVTNRIKHGEDGFLYQHNAPYMLAYFVDRIFEDDDLARQISSTGVENAKELFSIEANQRRIVEIYEDVGCR